jgi:pyruvate ferredoxin oxidoreductase alpha subunit
MPDQAEVDKFLPPYAPFATLHPDKPVTMGALGMPEIFNESMKAKEMALVNSKKVILQVWKEWEKIFGRKYEPVSSYRTADAKVVLLTMGSMGETAEMAVDELRRQGRPVGLLKLKLWRPFPFEELKKAVKGAKVLAVLDRAVSFGGPGGPVGAEIRSALYGEPDRPVVMDYIIGLGGRDMTVEDFIAIAEKASQAEKRKTKELYEIYGVRGQ